MQLFQNLRCKGLEEGQHVEVCLCVHAGVLREGTSHLVDFLRKDVGCEDSNDVLEVSHINCFSASIISPIWALRFMISPTTPDYLGLTTLLNRDKLINSQDGLKMIEEKKQNLVKDIREH